jgi:hypothetical protein
MMSSPGLTPTTFSPTRFTRLQNGSAPNCCIPWLQDGNANAYNRFLALRDQMTNQQIPWHELKAHRQELKDGLSDGVDLKRSQLFDEFMREHEFELALHLLCDYLLERTTQPAAPAIVKLVEKLHASMQIVDNCVANLHAVGRRGS